MTNVLLGSDAGVIVIRAPGGDAISVAPWDDNTLVETRKGPAATDELWITTGDQWGPFSVTTRSLPGPPDGVDDEWEDVVELSFSTNGPVVVTELVDHDPSVPLVDGAGDYRLRVSARGRASASLEDEDEPAQDESAPIEWYLLEVWPAPISEPRVLRLTSPFAQEQLAGEAPPVVVPEATAGLAASVRIGRDVDGAPGARTLSGTVGSVEAERTIRGTRRKHFLLCAHVTTWSHLCTPLPTWSWMGGGADYELGAESWAFADDHADQLSGSRGGIRTSFVEVDKPRRAVRLWNWVVSPGRSASVDQWVPFLAEDTIVTVTLDQSRDSAGDPWTTIRIRHDGLPSEWLDDMKTWWDFQLAIAYHVESGT